MLTPCFEVAQDDAFVIITMRVPFVKVGTYVLLLSCIQSEMLYRRLRRLSSLLMAVPSSFIANRIS